MILETSPAKKSSSPIPSIPSPIAPKPPPMPPAAEPGPCSTMTRCAGADSCCCCCAAYIWLNWLFGMITDSFVIVFIFDVSFSMRSSLFFSALFNFSLMKMWFSLESFRFAFSFLSVLKSARARYNFSSNHYILCSSFLIYSRWSNVPTSCIAVEFPVGPSLPLHMAWSPGAIELPAKL